MGKALSTQAWGLIGVQMPRTHIYISGCGNLNTWRLRQEIPGAETDKGDPRNKMLSWSSWNSEFWVQQETQPQHIMWWVMHFRPPTCTFVHVCIHMQISMQTYMSMYKGKINLMRLSYFYITLGPQHSWMGLNTWTAERWGWNDATAKLDFSFGYFI